MTMRVDLTRGRKNEKHVGTGCVDASPIFSGSVRGVRFGFGQSGIGGWYCCRAVRHQNVRSGSRHGVVVDDSLDVDQKWQSFLANEGWKISKEIYSTLEATTNLLDTADGTHAKWSSDGQLGLLLVFSWDLDGNVDSNSDGDPRNDDDGFGESVVWSYNVSGPTTVVCQIMNDAGLVAEFEVLVNVLSGNEGDSMDLMQLGLMVAGALVVVIMISLLVWRFMSNRRLATMIAEDDQPEQDVSAIPSVEEQKAMWGGTEPAMQAEQPAQQVFGDISSGMSGSTLGISTAMGEPEGEELDPDIAALLQSSSEPGSSDSSAANELLSEFDDDDDDTVEREDIDFSHESETEETVSNWSPGENEAEVFQPDESEPKPDRKVQQSCSSCDKKFEVELPPGVDAARTACPHCGSIESVSLD